MKAYLGNRGVAGQSRARTKVMGSGSQSQVTIKTSCSMPKNQHTSPNLNYYMAITIIIQAAHGNGFDCCTVM